MCFVLSFHFLFPYQTHYCLLQELVQTAIRFACQTHINIHAQRKLLLHHGTLCGGLWHGSEVQKEEGTKEESAAKKIFTVTIMLQNQRWGIKI